MMDNIIEIIITFFIIYSILNMIAGGKKQQKRSSEFPDNVDEKDFDNTSPSDYKSKNSSKQPVSLEDLFGIKYQKSEDHNNKKQYEESTSLESSISWDPEKEFQEKIKQKEKIEYRNIEKNIPDIDYDKTPSYEIAATRRVDKQDVKVYEDKKVFDNRLLNIKTKLKNPETIRELFIISEILSKPKSLRK